MLKKSWLYGISILGLSTQLAFSAPQTTAANFMSVADIHFDPLASCLNQTQSCPIAVLLKRADYTQWHDIFEKYDTSPIRYYQDTNYALLKTTLTELKKVRADVKPQFALVLGDFLAHDFRNHYIEYTGDKSKSGYEAFVHKTLQYLTQELKQCFPDIDVYPLVGNNDSYTGDYDVDPQGTFFSDTAEVWSSFINDPENRDQLKNTFPKAGYYAVTLPQDRHFKVILLNTVLFSTCCSSGKAAAKAAAQEFNWLHAELVAAQQQQQKVILALHIPFGVDIFTTIKSKFKSIQDFWQAPYTQRMNAEIQMFAPIITQILPAHIHMDAFQVVAMMQPIQIPISFTPSISPVLGNNPGFKVYWYNTANFKLQNYDSYYYPLHNSSPVWSKEYSLNQINLPGCQAWKVMYKTSAV